MGAILRRNCKLVESDKDIMALSEDQIGINVASLGGYDLHQAIQKASDWGLGSIELLGMDGHRHAQGALPGFWFDALTDDQKEELKSACTPFKHKAIHAPIVDLPLVSSNPGVKKLASERIKENIRAMEFIGGQVVVIHTSRKTQYSVSEFWGELIDTIKELGDYAGEHGVMIGVENVPNTGPTDADEFLRLIYQVDHPSVGATIDTGHVLGFVSKSLHGTSEGEHLFAQTLADMADRLASLTLHVHIHDVRRRDWRDHREVGTGIVDYIPFFQQLQKNDFAGALSLELEEPDRIGAIERSVSQIKQFIQMTAATTAATV